MIRYIVKKMISLGVIAPQDLDIYVYGLNALFIYASFFAVSTVCAFYMKQVEVLFTIIIFGMGLRRNLGGVHLSNSFSCFLLSIIYVLIPMRICSSDNSFLCIELYNCVIICVITIILQTLLFGVVKNKNKVYTLNLLKKSQYKAIGIVVIIAVICTIALFLQMKKILFVFAYILLTQIFSYFLGKIVDSQK